jgi:glycerophosphoryl diester phosphodiesterase
MVAVDLLLQLDGRTVRLKAHGCRLDGSVPGNSLAALRACVAAGVASFEVDVCALADGGFLVAHRAEELADGTTGRGPARAIDSAAARGLRIVEPGHGEAGAPAGRRPGAGHPVPLLTDLLPEARMGTLQLDLKDAEPLPEHLLGALARQIAPYAERVVVGSGTAPTLAGLRARLPGLRLGFDPLLRLDYRDGRFVGPLAPPGGPAHLRPAAAGALFERMRADAPSAWIWYLRAAMLVRLADDGFDAVGWLRARGVGEVDAWTIDVPAAPEELAPRLALLRRVVGLGVTQVTTNTPLAWLRLLAPSRDPVGSPDRPPV